MNDDQLTATLCEAWTSAHVEPAEEVSFSRQCARHSSEIVGRRARLNIISAGLEPPPQVAEVSIAERRQRLEQRVSYLQRNDCKHVRFEDVWEGE